MNLFPELWLNFERLDSILDELLPLSKEIGIVISSSEEIEENYSHGPDILFVDLLHQPFRGTEDLLSELRVVFAQLGYLQMSAAAESNEFDDKPF